MNLNAIQQLCQTIHNAFTPAAQQNPLPLLLIAGFLVCNAGLYTLTRGKEFVIGGLASAMFLIPFLKM